LVTPGKINRLWYPSRRGAIILFAALIVLGLILAGIAVAFANRHRIENAFAMLRCRWQNRALVVDPPLGEDGDIEPSEYGSFDFDLECQTTDHDELEATESDTEALHELSAEEIHLEVDEEKADQLITDSLAKSLIKRDTSPISTTGNKRESISVDIISDSFSPGERVDINVLKKKRLVEQDTGYIKIVGGGRIDKALRVYANDFSLVAVKMLVLTGGEAIKVASAKEKSQGE
jgi:ribosomal protein L18E